MRKLLFLLIVFSIFALADEESKKIDVTNLDNFDLPETGAEIIEFKGDKAFQIKPAPGTRMATFKNLEFENGIIEVDIAAIPRFTGIAFRSRSTDIYEAIYFRPQNSSNPQKSCFTVQYISHPRYSWHFLRGTYPGKYESSAKITMDEWFHVKLIIKDKTLKVFVDDTMVLEIDEMFHGLSSGKIALWAGNTSGATFKNFSYTPLPANSDSAKFTADLKYTAEQEYLFDVFENRRSIRKFKSTNIPDEHLQKILEVAKSGPTSGNQQPWKFLVITDRTKLDEIKNEAIEFGINYRKKRDDWDPSKEAELRKRGDMFYGGFLSAPVYVVVLVDKNSKWPSYNVYDGSIAGSYLMVAARALGYGTVFSQDTINRSILKKVMNIPDNYVQICFTPIGIPADDWPESKAKKPLGEVVTYNSIQ